MASGTSTKGALVAFKVGTHSVADPLNHPSRRYSQLEGMISIRWPRAVAVPVPVPVPVALYLGLVMPFGRIGIYWNGWTIVPMVDGALHPHFDLATMWQHHDENRMFAPCVVMTALGYATHLNTPATLHANAASFIASIQFPKGAYR